MLLYSARKRGENSMYIDEMLNLDEHGKAEREKRVCHGCIGNKALRKYIQT